MCTFPQFFLEDPNGVITTKDSSQVEDTSADLMDTL